MGLTMRPKGVGRNLLTTRIGLLIVWIGWHTSVTTEIFSKHAPVCLSVKNRKSYDFVRSWLAG